MTLQEAYAEGFCKAAEAAGIDPEYLVKQAQLKRNFRILSEGIKRLRNPRRLKRWFNLYKKRVLPTQLGVVLPAGAVGAAALYGEKHPGGRVYNMWHYFDDRVKSPQSNNDYNTSTTNNPYLNQGPYNNKINPTTTQLNDNNTNFGSMDGPADNNKPLTVSDYRNMGPVTNNNLMAFNKYR